MITDFRLSVFIAVARTLSFTRAARVLNVSQPAVSKHIKELEADFGEALFNRRGNSISLTDKGQAIIPYVESVIYAYTQLNDTISKEENNYEGTLHIGASTTIAQYVLPPMLARFKKLYPLIHLIIINANSNEVVRMLQNKEIELALIEDDEISNSLHYTPFTADEIVLLSTNKSNKTLKISDIEKLPLVIREEGSGTLSVIMSALKKEGVSRKNLSIDIQLGSSESILRYIKSSRSYAFQSILVAQEHIKRGELNVHEIENFSIKRQFRFVTRHGYNARLVNTFKSFCLSHYNF